MSFVVRPGEKIGIVGRTGSGKSSLIVALFRLVEPFQVGGRERAALCCVGCSAGCGLVWRVGAVCCGAWSSSAARASLSPTLPQPHPHPQGSITLDGHNLLDLGLDDVRGRIAAIPQDPVLFSGAWQCVGMQELGAVLAAAAPGRHRPGLPGCLLCPLVPHPPSHALPLPLPPRPTGTVRTNLDPYGRHTDAQLWDALGHVALKEVVSGLPEGLSARVAENGAWGTGRAGGRGGGLPLMRDCLPRWPPLT